MAFLEETIHNFNTLYSLSSTGKVKVWNIKVVKLSENINESYHWISSHGYQGGKQTEEISSEMYGKNLGKKNETSPVEQAILDATSKWQNKKDKNYSEEIPTSIDDFENIRPMLAHRWDEKKHNIKYPCYVQPKLNGVRTIATRTDSSNASFTSRGGKEYTTLLHLKNAIGLSLNGIEGHLDGEIFNPSMPFEDISSAVKKLKPSTANLQFWIFDIAVPGYTFGERLTILDRIADVLPENSPLVIVPSYVVNNEEELMTYHRQFSTEGYEGTIIRNINGLYRYDYRSTDLLKHKDFIDHEFIIIGSTQGHGSDEGTIIFTCMTADGAEFSVKPIGSREYRRELYNIRNTLVGKMLTVKFQNYSDVDGIPIFPVGLSVRDYE